MLERVAATRKLPIKKAVPGRTLERTRIIERIKAHVVRELPPDVLAGQGEALTALELLPADYDFVAGVFRLVEGQIAGFYEPEDGTMYLVDDLDEDEAFQTLAHELVHALQDQSFSLGPMLKFVAGDSDRLAAGHTLVEGDATSAMFDVTHGSAFDIDENTLRLAFTFGTALSPVGATTPHVLQASLTAPYIDGFSFVQALRKRGGWAAVDAAFKKLPASTEQLLHLDKLDAAEPPVTIAVPPVAALGSGFRPVLDDVMGEQGLRIALAEWAPRDVAARAAAGWGGDRYVVAKRDGDKPQFATGWWVRMDTPADAREVADVLKHRFGTACRERKALGPMAWRSVGADILVVAGPYERDGGVARSAGSCAGATAWLAALAR